MLSARQISLSRGQKCLFTDGDFTFYSGDKIGIIGRNGSGKSSLFALIQGQLTVDTGDLSIPKEIRLSSLAQHIPDSDESALNYVLGGDTEYAYWQAILDEATLKADHEKILHCHDVLQSINAYSKPALAATILHGLGFTHVEQSCSVKSFSGGWRMRLGLARCLMKPADLYLLDEPTNHLDLEAIIWLEKWIKQLSAMVLIISHDRDFLDATVNKILHLDQQTFKIYTGHYSFFEKARAMHLQQQQQAYEKQQLQIKHLMSYVDRFRAQATKAKQAQSRLKAIDRMEIIALAHIDNEFSFEFLPQKSISHHLLKCNDISVGYDNHPNLIEHIRWMVHAHDRIGILGANGQGKSTFIKTLVGEIKPKEGDIHYAKDLVIGYFAQHQIEQLDMKLSPIETILEMDPKASEQSIRQFLGGFLFQGDMATSPIAPFSGGEKARLALAKLVWQRPHLLLLDEPTNHLDLDMRSAIEMALQTYQGAVILISHDRHLLNSTVNDFYLVHDKKLEAFDGDLEDYYQWLNQRDKLQEQASDKPVKDIDYKQQKQWQNQLKRLETQINKLENEQSELKNQLFDENLYQDSQKDKLAVLQLKLATNQKNLESLEEEWLSISSLLEQ